MPNVCVHRVSWNPASLFWKEVSLHGILLTVAPTDEIVQAIEAVSAGTVAGGWVRPSIEHNEFIFKQITFLGRHQAVIKLSPNPHPCM